MKKHIFVLSALIAGFVILPVFAAENPPQAIATVFDSYARIQAVLAQDSLQNVTKEAGAIATAVSGDTAKTFSTNVGHQAEAVAKATDLKGARVAFKALSLALIEFASKNPALAGSYRQVHCPMVNADWLQKEATVKNPYLGKEMPQCGEFVKSGN
jgi:hypothetical protein